MAKCKFSIPFSGSATSLHQKAEAAITKAGGLFAGNEEEGQFLLQTPLGKIEGMYTIAESLIAVVITGKPMMVGCGTIESELRKYLAA